MNYLKQVLQLESNKCNCVLLLIVAQLLCHVWLFAIVWTAAHQASLSSTISWSLFKFMSIESGMLSNYLILCHPLLLPLIFPSIMDFSNINHSPSNEYLGVISFRIDCFSLLAVPCSPRYFQEPSPALQFESISSSVLSPFYGPTLTSVHDYWKKP